MKVNIDGTTFEEISREEFEREKDVAKFIIWDSKDVYKKEYYFKRIKYIPKKWRDKEESECQ